MKPSKTDKTELYTIEYYRWWGWIPRNQNCIMVLYVGNDPDKRHYSTHHANDLPEGVLLPGKVKDASPVEEEGSGANNAEVAESGDGSSPMAGPPGMTGPPEEGAGGEKQGKGRPQDKGIKAEAAKASEGDDSKKTDAPKKKTSAQEKAEPKQDAEPATDGAKDGK